MEITRVFDILELHKTKYQKDDVLCGKVNKQWKKYTSNDLVNYANLVSYGLLSLGLNKGDKVAIIAGNRPEWVFTDFGCQQAGVITVPVFPTIANNDLKFILNHAEVKAVFIDDKNAYEKLAAIEQDIPLVKNVISFNKLENVFHFEEFLAKADKNLYEQKVNETKTYIAPNEMFTILYTSGTTGIPKGVMISHHNIVQNILSVQYFAPFASWWKALSFLPLNHVYERVLINLYLYLGISVYFAEGFETIGDNLKEVKPQIFVSVPRLIERVFERISAAGEKLSGFKKKMFDWSMDLALKYEPDGANGMLYEMKRKIADKLVYSKWRDAIGGKLVCLASGGAALNPKLERVFLCAKIVVLQGYGLTETAVVVSVNRFGKGNLRIGCVGEVIDNSQVKIAEEDGEILVKGPSIMLGYYKNPEATAEVMDADGWFHTGDVGRFEGKFLKITDRKKEIFKTSAGKYITPLAIENKLKECRFIEQCMVVGESQKFASAIIVPNFTNFKEYCKQNNIAWSDNAAMSQHPDLKKIINDHVKNVNKTLAPYEQLKRCELLKTEWTIDGGEVTPKLSLKRKVIKEKNIEAINRIYAIED